MRSSNFTSPAEWGKALLLLVVGLTAAELLVRSTYASPSATYADQRYGTTMRPGAKVIYAAEGYSVNRLNSLGLFDDEPLDPPADHRAVILGDSYAEAKQVARERTFAVRLEELVDGLEVQNAGMSGRSPVHSSTYFADHADTLAPDVVIFQINDGDFQDLIDGGKTAVGSTDHIVRRLMRKSALFTLVVRRATALYGTERSRLEGKFDDADDAPVVESDEVHPNVPRYLGEAIDRVRAHGKPLVVVYIPHVNYFDDPIRRKFPERRDFYAAFFAERGIAFVDPGDDFIDHFRTTGQPAHGFHNSTMGSGHINHRGHDLVARALAPVVKDLLR